MNDQERIPEPEQGELQQYLIRECGVDAHSTVVLPIFCDWDFAVAATADIAIEAARLGASLHLVTGDSRTVRVGLNGETMPSCLGSRGPRRLLESLRSAILDSVSGASVSLHVMTSTEIHDGRLSIPSAGIPRQELRQLTVRGLDVGRAILQNPPDPEISIAEQELWPSGWVREAVRAFLSVHEQTRSLLAATLATHVFAYNGRFLLERAVVLSASELEVPIYCYDNAGSDCDFEIERNSIHDWSRLQDRIKRLRDEVVVEPGLTAGNEWFESRSKHADAEVLRFVGQQQRGQGIAIDEGKKPIVFFSSSIDEIAELDFDWSLYFGSQERALATLADMCRTRDDLVLVVRSHPNMLTKSQKDQAAWLACVEGVAPDVHLRPDSSVDSYELVSGAYAVVSYGSTMGVEAAHAGKRSIVMGPSIYDELDVAMRVRTPEELQSAIDADFVPNEINLRAYGLMMRIRGFRLKNVVKGDDSYRVKGRALMESRNGPLHRVERACQVSARRRLLR